jgi:hypothetical protein
MLQRAVLPLLLGCSSVDSSSPCLAALCSSHWHLLALLVTITQTPFVAMSWVGSSGACFCLNEWPLGAELYHACGSVGKQPAAWSVLSTAQLRCFWRVCRGSSCFAAAPQLPVVLHAAQQPTALAGVQHMVQHGSAFEGTQHTWYDLPAC